MKRLLIIDDEPGLRLMLRAVAEDAGWDVSEADSGEEGLALAQDSGSGVILLDMRLPGLDGRQTLEILRRRRPDMPVIMLTAHGSVDLAVEAMKQGAHDFLTKPVDNDILLATLDRAWEYGRLLAEHAALAKGRPLPAAAEAGDPLRHLVGDGPAMRAVKELVAKAAPSEATILVLGESGVGKELIATALHLASRRARQPLIKINCAALPETLLESELFGYKKGAFTGAVKDKPGRFVLADGGTLFLDEVGEMPVTVQARLLRALQERVVEPLGCTRSVPVDVRLVAATNKDLRQAVAAGEFREDLYFRLNVLEIVAPPLRHRLEDLPLLVGHLLDKLGRKNHKPVRGVTPRFLDALRAYPWPGNVRELENVLERAIVLAQGDMLDHALLPERVVEAVAGPAAAGASPPSAPAHASALAQARAPTTERDPIDAVTPDLLDAAERQALRQALEAHGGHRQRTAEALGMSRRTLQYKLARHGLARGRDAGNKDAEETP